MLETIIFIIFVVLAVVAIIMAVSHRPYMNWLIGAGIALVLWLVLAYAVHA